MINKLIFLFLLFSIVDASANIKEKIIQNLETTNNLTFNFEQNINGKTENGHCALSYPQKIFCKYNLKNKKILVPRASNARKILIEGLSNLNNYVRELCIYKSVLPSTKLQDQIKEKIIANDVFGVTFTSSSTVENFFKSERRKIQPAEVSHHVGRSWSPTPCRISYCWYGG